MGRYFKQQCLKYEAGSKLDPNSHRGETMRKRQDVTVPKATLHRLAEGIKAVGNHPRQHMQYAAHPEPGKPIPQEPVRQTYRDHPSNLLRHDLDRASEVMAAYPPTRRRQG